MKRSGFKRRTTVQRDWHKPAKLGTGIPKALGLRIKPKTHMLHSEKHLVLVRAQHCLITHTLVGVQAHHADELFPDVRGSYLSDFLAVPLHFSMHDPRFPGSVHQVGASENWWATKGRSAEEVLGWLATFLRRHYDPSHTKVAHALAQIERRRTMNGGKT